MEQFPNGNILITTNEDIQILDKNFNILQKFRAKVKNIFIKNDTTFSSFDEYLIDIWSYENIKINHLSQIKYNGTEEIKHLEIINGYDIIGLDRRIIFYYKANKIKDYGNNDIIEYKYEYDKISILKGDCSFDHFFITKDKKYLILVYIRGNYHIEIY